MQKITIKKGHNINISGLASREFSNAPTQKFVSISPQDFNYIKPKLLVKEGDQVSLGQPIFHDKSDESIKIASPVSGKIVEIVRGAKRKILNIIIKREGDRIVNFKIPALSNVCLLYTSPSPRDS